MLECSTKERNRQYVVLYLFYSGEFTDPLNENGIHNLVHKHLVPGIVPAVPFVRRVPLRCFCRVLRTNRFAATLMRVDFRQLTTSAPTFDRSTAQQ
ncbi:hypothetical protein BHE74_00041933 [Ensete ventricosum]|nr:hypothetical protein BHE74_00041933 [Ensete ventricosum]